MSHTILRCQTNDIMGWKLKVQDRWGDETLKALGIPREWDKEDKEF